MFSPDFNFGATLFLYFGSSGHVAIFYLKLDRSEFLKKRAPTFTGTCTFQ